MADLFLKIVNMSISAGWLVLAVVVLRLFLKKAPKRFRPVLWGIVGVRLLLPFSIESALSLIPSAETVSPEIMYAREPAIHSGIPALNSAVNPVLSESFAPAPAVSANPLQIWIPLAAVIWIAGILVMLAYTAFSCARLRGQVKTAIRLQDNIYQSEHVASPFVLGLFRPRIYLPFRLSEQDMSHVIAHERAHIKRRDHWIKPIGFLLLAVYWFNPVLWLAYILLCRDIELACDERVVKDLGADQRADYSEALLACSVPRRRIAACPLAFGEVGVKGRVKNVLNYKKPAFWIIVAAVAACIVVAVCFLTNPKTEHADAPSDDDIQWDTRPTIIMDGAAYINPYMPESELPYGYEYAGTLSDEQANDTGLAGCEYYADPSDGDSFYVFQECGTPISINTVDTTQRQWAYVRWIREETDAVQGRTLTMDNVRLLAQRGYGLTWTDFDRYSYTETGSGLYIRVYEIDKMFSLWIGGSSLAADPIYIYLRANDGSDEQIDIRDNGVEEFIAQHKNSSVVQECTYGWQCSPVGYSQEICEKLLAIGASSGDSAVSLPVVRINNTEELESFLTKAGPELDDSRTYPDTLAFSDMIGQYDAEFFESTTLFLVYITAGSSADRYSVDYVRKSAGTLTIGIMVSEQEGDAMMEGWIMAIGVPTDQISDVTELDAWISSSYDLTGNLLRRYTFAEGIGTSISLYDNGEFQFVFSLISSYLGNGQYEIENSRLTLRTDDGNYTYVFDMVGDTLVFDADASSELTWFSGLYDGAVLQ